MSKGETPIRRARVVGTVIGLLGTAIAIGLFLNGILREGKGDTWWFVIGIVSLVIICGVALKVSSDWLAPGILIGIVLLSVGSFLVNNFLLPHLGNTSGMEIAFWIGMIIEVLVVGLSLIWLIVHIRSWSSGHNNPD
jgi:hypothetical protein